MDEIGGEERFMFPERSVGTAGAVGPGGMTSVDTIGVTGPGVGVSKPSRVFPKRVHRRISAIIANAPYQALNFIVLRIYKFTRTAF
jgi:hypothetical protein